MPAGLEEARTKAMRKQIEIHSRSELIRNGNLRLISHSQPLWKVQQKERK